MGQPKDLVLNEELSDFLDQLLEEKNITVKALADRVRFHFGENRSEIALMTAQGYINRIRSGQFQARIDKFEKNNKLYLYRLAVIFNEFQVDKNNKMVKKVISVYGSNLFIYPPSSDE